MSTDAAPLSSLDEWEDFLKVRYPEGKGEEKFRDYEADARPSVREFYRLNHANQTLAFVKSKKAEFLTLNRKTMGAWEAMEFLNQLVDDSDPDGDFTQIEHLLLCAEAARRDGRPDWFVVTTLIHDLGKILCLFGEPQWAVVGDTFPVGCQFSEKCVFPQYFRANPDFNDPVYRSECGIYSPNAGLENVDLSWGHDEYLYHVVKEFSSRRSPLHDPLSQLLPVAQRGRLRPSDQRAGPSAPAVGAGVQPVRPLHQGRCQTRCRGAEALLQGASGPVFPRAAALVGNGEERYFFVTRRAMRRFFARPSAVSLPPTGCASP